MSATPEPNIRQHGEDTTAFDEAAWWGDCSNTFHEEQKQIVYARLMGIPPYENSARPPSYDVRGLKVLDVGGGPVSLLLKCTGAARRMVVDPTPYPAWTLARYEAAGIEYLDLPGEEIWNYGLDDGGGFDEAWCYNVLQHVEDPAEVADGMRRCARVVRVFEWVDVDPYPGHPHRLSADDLERWFGLPGRVVHLDGDGCVGRAWYCSGEPEPLPIRVAR